LWLLAGDRNTKFSHRVANLHRKFNTIFIIEVNGTRLDSLTEMKSAICGFYKALYTETETWRRLTNGLPLNQLRVVDRDSLELPFTEEEVLKALSECYGDKALGPDGMMMAFLKHNWVTLKGDVMKMFAEFFASGKFVASLNSTFIALILKKARAIDIKDFRPISLVGSICKLLSKVLARRLKGVTGSLIFKNHNTFVGGRQILDAVLIANELIDSRLKFAREGVVCKLDVEKVYDHVNWNFLLYVLKRTGFGVRWMRWI